MDFKIWPPYEVFYIQSMLFNTSSAINSINSLSTVLVSSFESAQSEDNASHEEVLNSVHNIVVQGAALSRYFWPIRKGHNARAELLRSASAVSDDNVLKCRDLRNAIEHFDEKLDDYVADEVVGHIFPQYVGPLPQDTSIPVHIFRAYYTDVALFELLGKQYAIEPIAKEILRIHRRLISLAENGGRLLPFTGA